MHRSTVFLSIAVWVLAMICPLVIASDTSTLNGGGYVSYYVCGTNINSQSGALCSQTTVSYSITATVGVYVYWMNYTDYQSWRQNTLGSPRYDATHSCGGGATKCSFSSFIANDPDKVLLIYNSIFNSASTVQATINTNPQASSSAGLVVGAIVGIVIAAVCVPCAILGLLMYCCGWCCCRRTVHQTVIMNSIAQSPVGLASENKYGNLDGRGVHPVNIQMLPVTPGSDMRRSSVSVV